MVDQDERHERRERWVQNLVFAGMLVVLATVVGAGVTIRHEREAADLRQTPSPALRRTPASRALSTPAGAATPYPVPFLPSAAGVGTFTLAEPIGELDPLKAFKATEQPGSPDTFSLSAFFLGLYGEMHIAERVTVAPIPVLAQAMDVSSDGLVYTVQLRQDIYWVQCDPRSREVRKRRQVVADDVLYAYERLADSGRENEIIAGVTVVDPFTVRFTLGRSISPAEGEAAMQNRLTMADIWPVPHEPEGAYAQDWAQPGAIWVNGPYCPLAWKEGGSLAVVANPWLPEDLRVEVGSGFAPWLAPQPAGVPGAYPTPESAAPSSNLLTQIRLQLATISPAQDLRGLVSWCSTGALPWQPNGPDWPDPRRKPRRSGCPPDLRGFRRIASVPRAFFLRRSSGLSSPSINLGGLAGKLRMAYRPIEAKLWSEL